MKFEIWMYRIMCFFFIAASIILVNQTIELKKEKEAITVLAKKKRNLIISDNKTTIYGKKIDCPYSLTEGANRFCWRVVGGLEELTFSPYGVKETAIFKLDRVQKWKMVKAEN